MRRKYSTPIRIDTPLELYQQLKNFVPATKLKMVYGQYAKCFLRTVDDSILLQLRKDFPLSEALKVNRPYISVGQLLVVLEQEMVEIIRLQRVAARQLVGHHSITEAYDTLDVFKNKGFQFNICYSACNKIIILSEYSIYLPSSKLQSRILDNLTNNSALLYLRLDFLQKHLKDDAKLKLNYSVAVDELIDEMQNIFGSDLFGKIHVLQEVLNPKV